MKVVRTFNKKPLDCRICESLRIDARPQSESLNSKHEYAQSGIIRVSFESDITKAKNEKLLLKEAFKPKDNSEANTSKPTNPTKTPGRIFRRRRAVNFF